MRVVVALGGNALLQRGQPVDAETQVAHIRRAAAAIAPLAEEHELVVTHGNGPQVGLLAMQAEALAGGPRIPVDELGAESEGWIGYLLDRELAGLLPHRSVATLLTQTLVDPADPAFEAPTKPIGPVFPADRARELASRGWTVRPDGDGVRRVVPSPAPLGIVELPAIRLLLERKVLVICTGGGGIPVTVEHGLRLRGVDAVVDKDAASALLATGIGAGALLLLTDVDAVYADWPAREHPVREVRADALDLDGFDAGSMGPKLAAAAAFARNGGIAAIGALDQAGAILRGAAGTRILPPES